MHSFIHLYCTLIVILPPPPAPTSRPFSTRPPATDKNPVVQALACHDDSATMSMDPPEPAPYKLNPVELPPSDKMTPHTCTYAAVITT